MDRQRTQGSLDRATGTMKEKSGEAPGDRHVGRAEKTDAPRPTKNDPLDAVREVVNNED
jgi:hypothetical protein